MRVIFFLMIVSFMSGPLRAQTAEERPEADPMMQQMQGHMQSMREQMERIQETEDPEERQRLMREHMESMHEGMQMLGRMMGGGMGQGQPSAMAPCGEGDTACQMERMERRQRAMGQHMGMMHMMMEHMMQHMSERQMSEEHGGQGQ